MPDATKPTPADRERDLERDLAVAHEVTDDALWAWGEADDRIWMRHAREGWPAAIRLLLEAREVLRTLEWQGDPENLACPECRSPKSGGTHHHDCRLALAVAARRRYA